MGFVAISSCNTTRYFTSIGLKHITVDELVSPMERPHQPQNKRDGDD